MTLYLKDPQSTVDYSVDWTTWLVAGEAITSTEWSITPSDTSAPTLGNIIDGDTVQGVYVSGGIAGRRYHLTCRIETDAGRQADRSLSLRIMER
ncbi:phage fiber-tail adaptor protein [Kordiimonas aquimaris]|uniref:phage fiber-tail adaptor protein n=1 Tax=Kordiimonas aquimaris TaxID=707591 RepID=UPI0021D11C37|nr:hypothetical protein [Kordiimonas aquimaris]